MDDRLYSICGAVGYADIPVGTLNQESTFEPLGQA